MLLFNATVAFCPQAVLLNSRGTKEGNTRSLGGCCLLHTSFMAAYIHFQCVVMLEPCLEASCLYSAHKKQSSCRTGECGSFWKQRAALTLCRETGPVRAGVAGLGSHLLGQRRPRSSVGIYGWELVILLCV